MVTLEELDEMEQCKIEETNPATLTDIQEVKITGQTSAQRLESYLSQVKNPYCFRVGKTPVKISFNSCANSIENKLKSYFIGVKS